jgi:glycerol-3-phosphate O-acyltransferase / dihydroxyacetone phosphate acyltransferase
LRVIRREAKRRVSFLIAAKSMQRPVIGVGAKMVGAVPVARAQDYVKKAQGTIYMPDPNHDPLLIRGHGTNFENKNIQVGGRIVLPKVKGVAPHADVAKVISPTELRIKKPFRDTVAINLLTGKGNVIPDGKTAADMSKDFQGSPFSSTPKLDQQGVFDSVFQMLLSGGCVGIFPEGGSHDRPELLPLQGLSSAST